jgi:hypothetical protein
MAIQAKLAIGEPNDKYEQEADRVAQQVVQRLSFSDRGQSANGKTLPPPNQTLQREVEPDEEDELQMKPLVEQIQRMELPDDDELQMKPLLQREVELDEEDELQMKPDSLQREVGPDEEDELQMKPLLQRQGGGAVAASDDLESAIQQSRGSGQPLSESIREPMEQAFGGVDFRGVNVHTDGRSDQLNRSIQAKAFTTGHDIFFRQGAYQPGSSSGQELLAHELTHVVQQRGSQRNKMGEKTTQQSPLNKTMRNRHLQNEIDIQCQYKDEAILAQLTVHWESEVSRLELDKNTEPVKQVLNEVIEAGDDNDWNFMKDIDEQTITDKLEMIKDPPSYKGVDDDSDDDSLDYPDSSDLNASKTVSEMEQISLNSALHEKFKRKHPDPEKKMESWVLQEASHKEVVKLYQKTLAVIKEVIEQVLTEGRRDRLYNTCEAIKNNRILVTLLAPYTIQEAEEGQRYCVPAVQEGNDIYGTHAWMSKEKLEEEDLEVEGNDTPIGGSRRGNILLYADQITDRDLIKETLRHEGQHILDKSESKKSKYASEDHEIVEGNSWQYELERYKTEYRAFNYEERATKEPLDPKKMIKIKGTDYEMTEPQFYVFKEIYEAYPDVRNWWETQSDDGAAFRKGVIDYKNPDVEGFNKWNSIWIDNFYNCLMECEIKDEDQISHFTKLLDAAQELQPEEATFIIDSNDYKNEIEKRLTKNNKAQLEVELFAREEGTEPKVSEISVLSDEDKGREEFGSSREHDVEDLAANRHIDREIVVFYQTLENKALRTNDISQWLFEIKKHWDALSPEQQGEVKKDKEKYAKLQALSQNMSTMMS